MKEQDIPLIKLFIVEGKYYVYDTSTNRILSITKNHYLELIELLRLGVSAYLALNKNNKEYSDILRMMSLGLFRTNLIRNVGYYDKYLIPQMIDRCLNSVIFQVTKNCNFKCRYCLYASNTGVERNHSSEVMSFDVAKRTLDYLYSHSKDSAEISLSFYGGEPLLNFKLIREIVEYAEEIFVTKKLRYNITTNGSILTNEILEFLVRFNFSILVSLDGDEIVQNKHRRFLENGRTTYDIVYKNIMAIRESNSEFFYGNVRFNPVMFLDESEERVRKYFESIGVADEQVNISPADMNGIDYEYSKYLYNDMPVKKIMRRGFKKNRSENSVLNDPWIHNGSCIPSLVRLFVNTEGDFFPCEKITESPFLSIGNVSDGLDIDKITYMTDIAKLTEHQCRHCWGLRYCKTCILHCIDVDRGDISVEMKLKHCKYILKALESNMIDEIRNFRTDV